MTEFGSAMQEALNSPRYFYLTGGFDGFGELIMDIVIRILEAIFNLFDIQATGIGDGVNIDVISGIFVAIAIFIVIATIIFIAHIIYKRRRNSQKYSAEIFEDYRNNRLSFDEIMALAKKHDEDKNLKEAVRYRYIGLIMFFSAREIVNVTDSMTGNQFEREAVKNMPSVQSGVRDTINMYYNLFFGHKSVSQEAYEKHLESYNAVMKEAQSYGK